MILLFYNMKASYGYGEANYFLLRIDKIKLGQVPYIDFEYAYGLTLLYFPILLSKIFNLTTPQSYYLAYAIFNLTGILFLKFVIDYLNINPISKKHLFYSITLCCLPFVLGVNYTLFRFITPIAGLLVIYNVINSNLETGKYYVIKISIITFLLAMLVLSISIEVGIAITVSLGSYFLVNTILNRDLKSLYILAIYIFLLTILFFFISNNLILILQVFASGGNNFPVVPAPAILFYIVSFLVINSIFASLVLTKRLNFMAFTLLVFNVTMLPGALGRCDPAHIFWYGLGSFIYLWTYLSHVKIRLYHHYKTFFIVIFTVGSTLSTLFLYKPAIAQVAVKYIATDDYAKSMFYKISDAIQLNLQGVKDNLVKVKSVKDFSKLDKCTSVSIPFDAIDPNLYLHVLNRGNFVPEYYTGIFLNVYAPEQIERKFADLKNPNHKYMIIPKRLYDTVPEIQSDVNAQKFMTILFLYPFTYNKKLHSETLYNPTYNYIRNNYKILEDYNTDYLVERI
jgi:hypothetical protein